MSLSFWDIIKDYAVKFINPMCSTPPSLLHYAIENINKSTEFLEVHNRLNLPEK